MALAAVYLTAEERTKVEEFARTGTHNAHLINRANILLVLDRTGKKDHMRVARRRAIDWANQMKWLIDDVYPTVEKIVLVMDNLTTHTIASFYKYFSPEEAFRLSQKLEIHYTPKHGSWLDIAELELSALSLQCLKNKRMPTIDELNAHMSHWHKSRNYKQKGVIWQFTTADARIKLKHLYPIIDL